MNAQREARRDAKEFARAQMFYGEGAGVRRKLIQASVDSKSQNNAAYGRAFHQALADQDMAEHASKARVERRRKDTTHLVGQNVKSLATGNYQGMSNGLMAMMVVGTVLYKTGLGAKAYSSAKERYRMHKARRQFKKNFPDIRFQK